MEVYLTVRENNKQSFTVARLLILARTGRSMSDDDKSLRGQNSETLNVV